MAKAKAKQPESEPAQITLVLSRNDVGQIMDGIRARMESWDNTAQFLESGHNPDDCMIEECSDPNEARNIAGHYREILNTMEQQIATNPRSGTRVITSPDKATTACLDRDENIAAVSAEMHTHEKWDEFYGNNCDELSGFPGFWCYAVGAGNAFTESETAFATNPAKCFEYPEAIFDYVEKIMTADTLPTLAGLRILADAAIEGARY